MANWKAQQRKEQLHAQGEQLRQSYQEVANRIMAHMSEMDKTAIYEFDTWLACTQALIQIQQTLLLQNIYELLSQGVPVYAMAL